MMAENSLVLEESVELEEVEITSDFKKTLRKVFTTKCINQIKRPFEKPDLPGIGNCVICEPDDYGNGFCRNYKGAEVPKYLYCQNLDSFTPVFSTSGLTCISFKGEQCRFFNGFFVDEKGVEYVSCVYKSVEEDGDRGVSKQSNLEADNQKREADVLKVA